VSGPEPAPPLTESARLIYDAARNVAGAWGGTFGALRRLLVADVALARAAIIRGLVLLFLSAILFGTAWVMLTALAVWGLYTAGAGWGVALVVPLIVSAVLGGIAYRQATKALRLADLDASRRQLTLWFGTPEEVKEAKHAPPGTLDAGAPAPGTPGASNIAGNGNMSDDADAVDDVRAPGNASEEDPNP
jgi:hypothetical protein